MKHGSRAFILTPAEKEVLTFSLAGMTVPQIAKLRSVKEVSVSAALAIAQQKMRATAFDDRRSSGFSPLAVARRGENRMDRIL